MNEPDERELDEQYAYYMSEAELDYDDERRAWTAYERWLDGTFTDDGTDAILTRVPQL